MATKTKKTGEFAVIKTGGKQYLVHEGETIQIEKLDQEDGKVEFEVLAIGSDDSIKIGTPLLSNKVTAEITENGRHKKVLVIKYKQKSRYFKKNGHRQPYTQVKIAAVK